MAPTLREGLNVFLWKTISQKSQTDDKLINGIYGILSSMTIYLTFILMLFQRRSLKFSAKVFERCELARELVNKQGFARATVGNWVCLANVGLIKI